MVQIPEMGCRGLIRGTGGKVTLTAVGNQDDTWRGLMCAAQAGDRASYDRLLREIAPFVRSLARRHCRHPEDLEEMVQETLLTVHRVRHTYDPARPFSPWLAAIAQRRAIDTLRRRQRVSHYETDQADAMETLAAPAANQELEGVRSGEEVQELLQHLPPRQRVALETVKLRELSLAEAAALSGQSEGALKVNVHRALKALRVLMLGRARRS